MNPFMAFQMFNRATSDIDNALRDNDITLTEAATFCAARADELGITNETMFETSEDAERWAKFVQRLSQRVTVAMKDHRVTWGEFFQITIAAAKEANVDFTIYSRNKGKAKR